MKTLYIIAKGMGKKSEEQLIRLEKEKRVPRTTLLEAALSATVLDERYLFENPPSIRRWLYRNIPVHLAQIIEALFIQHEYDIILSQSEKVGLPLAWIMKYLRMKTPHLSIVARITSRDKNKEKQKMWFVKKTKDHISRFIVWSSVQRKIAIEKLDVNPNRITHLKIGTDQKFWSPETSPPETDMICSAGMEMRDYPTLIQALKTLDIPCHIAAGATRGEIFNTVRRLYKINNLPKHLTVGFKKHEELREIYNRSRFIVVPLLQTDSDNGLTTILEAMSMGKPVICSRVEGLVDIVREGVTGIFVPQGDSEAMKEAILELWNDPERCKKMGKAAREYIEENHSMERFVQAVKEEAQSTLVENGAQVNDFNLSGVKT
ncbi:MAG: glycosyltransferase family 4 protein [Balneolaceae bacterium]